MPTTARAATVGSPGATPLVEDVLLADPRPGEVLVRVAATGVCHTDVALAAGEYTEGVDQFPIVLGHETSGVVEAVARNDSAFSVGDRVVIALTHHCGVCSYCERGTPILCARREDSPWRLSRADGSRLHQAYGVGGFAEAVIVREASLVRVPDDVPLVSAAVVGCAVACGIGAVWNIAGVRPGSSVVVFGAGAVGMSVVMGSALAGAHRITVVDPDQGRRERAVRLGATEGIGFDDDVLQHLMEGDGFDYAFESVGKADAMECAVRSTRRGGTVTLMGAPQRDVTFTLNALEFVSSQRKLLACLGGNVRPHDDFERYFRLYSRGRLDIDALVTGTLPLTAIADAFESSRSRDGLRTVVVND